MIRHQALKEQEELPSDRSIEHAPPPSSKEAASVGSLRTGVPTFGEGIHGLGVREIVHNIYWITHCLGTTPHPQMNGGIHGRRTNLPYSCSLIVDEKVALLDTIRPIARDQLFAALDSILGDRKLDYVWVSHVELPHGGNALSLAQRYPEAKLVVAKGGDHYQIHGLEKAQLVAPGDHINLGNHELEFVDPLFPDHGLTSWVYEQNSGLLSTVDWGNNLHSPPNECFKFFDELDASRPYAAEDILGQFRSQFSWLAWTQPKETTRAIDDMFARYDVRILAPMHASIVRRDIPAYVALLKQGVERAAELPFWWEGVPVDPETSK